MLTFYNQQNVPTGRIRHPIVSDAPEISHVLPLCIPDVQIRSAVRESHRCPLLQVVVLALPANMLLGQRFALDGALERHILPRPHHRILRRVHNRRSI